MFQVDFSKALSEVSVLLKTNVPTLMGLEKVCSILRKHIEHYDWVGFYFANFKKQTLNLKAFSGNPVEHTEIPFGKGGGGDIGRCGGDQAWQRGENRQRAQDHYCCTDSIYSDCIAGSSGHWNGGGNSNICI